MNFWRLFDPEHFDVIPLVTHEHHTFHLVSVMLAILAAWVFLPIVERFNAAQNNRRLAWLLAGSLAMGTGIWAMHFSAMLSYHVVDVVIEYDIFITVLSIIPAVLCSGIAILLAEQSANSRVQLLIMALFFAAGVGVMHYTGMEALISHNAEMYYIPSYFFLSLVSAFGFALVGLYLYFNLSHFGEFLQRHSRIISSLILGLAVSAMHFTAMKATYFIPIGELAGGNAENMHTGLKIGVATATSFLMGIIVIVSIVDEKFSLITRSLSKSEVKFERFAESTKAAIFIVKGDKITYANTALEEITGYERAALFKLPLKKLFGEKFATFVNDVFSDQPEAPHFELFEVSTASKQSRWLYIGMTVLISDDQSEGIASAFDITQQKQAELALHKLAYTDQLTNLPNRSMFMERLYNAIHQQTQDVNASNGWVMLLDLDKFKSINDINGHLFGDRLLIEVASRLLFVAAQRDVVARLGGDEFILLFQRFTNRQQIEQMAEEILRSLNRPYRLPQREIHISASIGILELDAQHRKADQVLHDVDIALYRAKLGRTSSWVIFDAEQDAQTKRERKLQPELKQAILDEHVEFFYQPIVDASTFKIKGFEALARWRRVSGERVDPSEFIALAEKTGLVGDIGLLGVKAACKQLCYWHRHCIVPDDVYVSVNIAAVSMIDNRFFDCIKSAFTEYNIKRGQLKLELTERMLVEDFESIVAKLNELIELGCEIMIDDFGTGYSSLSYLHLLPVSTLKIDRSFILTLEDKNGTEPLVKTIIALAKTLELDVISEGIEELSQARHLNKLGSTHLQGYYFAKPMPAEVIKDYLQEFGNV